MRGCLEDSERGRAAALRWRDDVMAALLPSPDAAGVADAELQAGLPPPDAPAEAWLPPPAWPLLPGGAPAALWPADSDATLAYTVCRLQPGPCFIIMMSRADAASRRRPGRSPALSLWLWQRRACSFRRLRWRRISRQHWARPSLLTWCVSPLSIS